MTASDPLIIVSNDTHIGPRLVEDLRPYCPSKHLEEFDRFAESMASERATFTTMLEGSGYLDHPNFRTRGHYESAARLADYDYDGVAAGVIFHGSTNMEPIPFVPQSFGETVPKPDPEMAAVGQSIYNRWLVDFVSQAPHRHIGLAYLPLFDLERALRRGALGARARTEGGQLPCHARWRVARVQPPAAGSRSGQRAKSSRCRW